MCDFDLKRVFDAAVYEVFVELLINALDTWIFSWFFFLQPKSMTNPSFQIESQFRNVFALLYFTQVCYDIESTTLVISVNLSIQLYIVPFGLWRNGTTKELQKMFKRTCSLLYRT